LYLFFFQCFHDHRDLHSFPTRRSSDLKCKNLRDSAGELFFGAASRGFPRPAEPCRFGASLPTRSSWRNSPNRSGVPHPSRRPSRSEEHTSELQSRFDLVCRLLLEKKKT